MLGRVQRPSAYASAMIGNGVVAVGRAVADDGWAGVSGMATLPHISVRHSGCTSGWVFYEVCGYHYRTPG